MHALAADFECSWQLVVGTAQAVPGQRVAVDVPEQSTAGAVQQHAGLMEVYIHLEAEQLLEFSVER